jgi:hypothetical protein
MSSVKITQITIVKTYRIYICFGAKVVQYNDYAFVHKNAMKSEVRCVKIDNR